jgi:hypothetical protein
LRRFYIRVFARRWQALADESRAKGDDLLVDIPLLFETEAAPLFDAAVTIACLSGDSNSSASHHAV